MILYATTIFLSAFLLFQVQPLIARLILPWFGGSAAVWTTCMLFFQVLLLAGYVYVHWLVKLRRLSSQRLVHCALLLVCLLLLPIVPDASWKPVGGEDPTLLILGLLTVSVGLPYFVLSTTGPLVQAWVARSRPGAYPYRLFALSNLGSLLALLSYPLLVEPLLSSRGQAIAWSAGFAIFALCCATLALKSTAGSTPLAVADEVAGRRPGFATKLWWSALAACASVLLLAFTSHLSLNIAPIPFLWILPLLLYLLSFIVSFDAPRWYRRDIFFPLLVVGVAGVCYTLSPEHRHPDIRILVPLYALTLFCACMLCHGELARSKPHPSHLTSFYLYLALGGALGGLFVGLLAPVLFNDLLELPISLAALSLLALIALYRDRGSVFFGRFALFAKALGVLLVGSLYGNLAWSYGGLAASVAKEVRSFYGVLKIQPSGSGLGSRRSLLHGTIQHGAQFDDAARRSWPTSYYGHFSGVALAIKSRPLPRRIGVVGLGTGTLASYGLDGDVLRFYEINSQVVDLARSEFSFLSDSKALIEVALGDARQTLERETNQQFDVLVLDAFSSDSIPVHLLTLEAFRSYLRHLKPDGILAVHISNRYLDLKPVIARLAQALDLHGRSVDSPSDLPIHVFNAKWVLLSPDPRAFENAGLKSAATVLEGSASTGLWTDEFSSLYEVLKFRTATPDTD